MGSDPHAAAPAAALAAAAATAPVFAGPRYSLSRRRGTTSDHVGTRLAAIGFGLLAAILALTLLVPEIAGFAMLTAMGVGPLAAAALLGEPLPARAARPLKLALAATLATATICALLSTNDRGLRVMLCGPWIVVAVLSHRGFGAGMPRGLVRLESVALLATVLLWCNLMATLHSEPAAMRPAQWMQRVDVFAGWPCPTWLGAMRGTAPAAGANPLALAIDWVVMLVVAALLLMRVGQPALLRWLPRMCVVLAVLHVVGGYQLAIATDG